MRKDCKEHLPREGSNKYVPLAQKEPSFLAQIKKYIQKKNTTTT